MLRQYTRVVIPSDTASDTAYAWLHPTIPALLCYLISLLNYSFIFWLSFLMSVYLPPSVQCLDAHKSSKMAEKTLYCARLVSYSIASMVVLYLFLYIEHSYLFRCQFFLLNRQEWNQCVHSAESKNVIYHQIELKSGQKLSVC